MSAHVVKCKQIIVQRKGIKTLVIVSNLKSFCNFLKNVVDEVETVESCVSYYTLRPKEK